MRNSEQPPADRFAFVALLAAAVLLSAACSGSPPTEVRPAAPAAVECAPAASTAPPDPQTLKELRTAIERSPLYLAAGAQSPAVSCAITGQASAWTLAYRFKDGATFTATRDTSIEYSNQEATFPTPPDEAPAAILHRAERESFGTDGCGIDWKSSATEAAADGSSTALIFRGSVCSCQAHIRSDARGRVIGLMLRSSC
jgi:hypothetical protein